ncbi:hypothetical protein V6N12_039670 [Hibiscus sabdariffa]|uniref:Uncharacterized protein n=1 Tax=Hibiscus sabdariffa TaxID=183260 RepID=A0ABR2E1D2_9ROSI
MVHCAITGDVFQLGMEMSALRLSRGRHASEGPAAGSPEWDLSVLCTERQKESRHAHADNKQVKLCSGNVN